MTGTRTLGVNGIRLVGDRSGVGRAVQAFLRHMDLVDHPFGRIRVYTPEPLDEEVHLPRGGESVVVQTRAPGSVWEQYHLMRAHGSRDVLFCPSYVIPVMARCPTVVAHHGSYEGFPEAFDWYTRNKARLAYSLSARRATAVSTVSEYSRRDMGRFYGIDPARIEVIPEGVDTKLFRPIVDEQLLAGWRHEVLGSDIPFVMYAGKPTERRNLTSLIQAFGQLKRETELPHQLLLVGLGAKKAHYDAVARDCGVKDDVVVPAEYGSHDFLSLAYNASNLLVYPSSYEGFGMPVLEAMACGTPVIALDNTAFPEFAGGIAHLLPDAKVETLRDGMSSVLRDPEWQAKMSRDGVSRAAQYDWLGITERYLELIISVM